MSLQHSLEVAQDVARQMLTSPQHFDAERSIPMRASSHTDLWNSDCWVEAYAAIGETELAGKVLAKTVDSIRPDGSVPHLVQGSHIRGGKETNWFDRGWYRYEGNGVMQLDNGSWVTRTYAAPTLALSALALEKAGGTLPENLTLEKISRSVEALYEARGNDEGLITSQRLDELTIHNQRGVLGSRVYEQGTAIDPAVNALAFLNNQALRGLADNHGHPLDLALVNQMRSTSQAVANLLWDEAASPIPERVLAAARLHGQVYTDLPDVYFSHVLARLAPRVKHPERFTITMADCIEIARLTPERSASQQYFERILPMIELKHEAWMTEFENRTPSTEPNSNKWLRKHRWLPTAAQIVQIDPNTI